MMYFMSDESFQSTQLRGEPFSYGPTVSPYAYAYVWKASLTSLIS